MFRESIQKVVDRVEGALAGVLMGFDGISVESYARGDAGPDIQTIGMELSHVISQVRKAAEILELGGLREVTLRTDNVFVLVNAVNDEYFVAAVLRADGNFGKARYLLRLLVPQILSEL